jgi:hypothetical protein
MKNIKYYCFIVFVSTNILLSQRLDDVKILNDDIYIFPYDMNLNNVTYDLNRSNRLRLKLSDIRFILKGDYNGDGFQEAALIGLFNQSFSNSPLETQISTLESKSYEILDPFLSYDDASMINTQEGYSGDRMLDYPGNTRGGYTNPTNNTYNQKTRNAIIDRHSSNIELISESFAVSGNFYPESGYVFDEILLFKRLNSSDENVTIFSHNDPNHPTSPKDYSFSELNIHNINYSEFTINSSMLYTSLNMVGTDNLDEVYILTRTGTNANKIISFRYNGSNWVFELKKTFLDSELNFTKIKGIASGDFNSDGDPEIVIAYDQDVNNQKIISILMDNSTYALSTYHTFTKSVYDFSKIESFISGDFNGDGEDQVCFIYKTAGEQTINLQKNNSSSGKDIVKSRYYDPSHINLSKNILFKLTSINIDYDINDRDDIIGLYLDKNDGIDNNGIDKTGSDYNSIISWISLPEFEDNDYMIEITENQVDKPFIPVGDYNVRLNSTSSTTDVSQLLHLGKRSDDFLSIHRKAFNTLMPTRETFCDKVDFDYGIMDPTSGGNEFDFFDDYSSSDPDDFDNSKKSYLHGLESYVSRAQSFGYKIIPWINMTAVFNYDRYETTSNHYYNYYNSPYTTWPEYVQEIFEFNSTNKIVQNNDNVIGYNFIEEPIVATKENDWGMHHHSNHFSRISTIPGHTYPDIDDRELMRDNHKSFFDEIHNYIDKPFFGTFNDKDEYEYYKDATNGYIFDSYPIITLQNSGQNFLLLNYANGLNSYTENLYDNMVRYNKDFISHWVQGYINDDPSERPVGKHSPVDEYLRFSLFGTTIKGMKGHFNFTHHNVYNNDTLFQRVYHRYSEYNFYLDWFKTEPLNHKVSMSNQLFTGTQYWGSGNKSKYYNNNLYYANGIYILVVTSAIENTAFEELDFTIFDVPSGGVYKLSPDYFNNGLYEGIYAGYYNGKYQFSDVIKRREVSIYAIGGLPSWNEPEEWIQNSEFGNSNQRQFIGYPTNYNNQNIVSTFLSEREVIYHTVYQREFEGITNIYYRRSKPVTRIDDLDTSPEGKLISDGIIKWEDEICVSNDIKIRNTIGPDFNNSLDNCLECIHNVQIVNSKNPSLIIDKPNPSDDLKVKIYFNADVEVEPMLCDVTYGTNNIIAEVEFNALGIQPTSPSANQLASYNGNLTDYGNPVVNSSLDGNFIAWSDSDDGINVLYKDYNTTCSNSCNLTTISKNNTNIDARHPSINPYSKVSEGHIDIGLVWQEKLDSQNEEDFEIYYTRVGYMDTISVICLENFVSDPSSTYYPHNHGLTYDSNKQILTLSTGWETSTHKMPIINRNVEIYTRPDITWINRHHKYDRVYWESYDEYNNREFISYASMDYFDSYNGSTGLFNPDMCVYGGPERIGAPNYNLSSPVNTNGNMGKSIIGGDTYYSDISDSIQVINFEVSSEGYNAVYQINTGYWDLNNNWDIVSNSFYKYSNDGPNDNSNDIPYVNKVTGKAYQPQLSVGPIAIGNLNWHFNKRLLEDNNNDIVPSIEHFLKPTLDNIDYSVLLNGYTDDKNYIELFSGLEIKTNENRILKIPFYNYKTNNKQKNVDYFVTPYFEIDTLNELSLYQYGNFNKGKIDLYIERLNDTNLIELNYKRNNNYKIEKNKFIILNSNKDTIRLVFKNKVKNVSRYTQELLINGLPDPNSELSKIVYQENFVDNGYLIVDIRNKNFNDLLLSLYPNPAKDKLIVYCKNYSDNNEFSYRLIDVNGIEIDKASISSNQFEIDISKINNNYFYLVVEYIDDFGFTKREMRLVIKE